jgi:hypothetical protein
MAAALDAIREVLDELGVASCAPAAGRAEWQPVTA